MVGVGIGSSVAAVCGPVRIVGLEKLNCLKELGYELEWVHRLLLDQLEIAAEDCSEGLVWHCAKQCTLRYEDR